MLIRSSSPPLRRAVTALVGATVLVAGLPAAAQAQPGAPRQPSRPALQAASPTVVPPMGATAATVTAQARRGAARPADRAAAGSAARRVQAARPFQELQLNLCNSGLAGCYRNGDAVYEGGDLMYYLAPDVVTLNEICLGDIAAYLQPSLAEAWPDDWTYSVFFPATDRRTNGPYRCRNGDEFGNAVIGRVPAASYRGVNGWAGEYVAQDAGTELRTFACAYAIGEHLACATHLTSASEPIALAQCRALMFDVVPYVRSTEGLAGRTVVGGDFNLEYDTADPENVQNCVPAGHTRKGDGDVQHVIFSNDLGFTGTRTYGLTYTDHPGFLVALVKP